jgi:ribose transport system substrate-binding protein
MVETNVRDERQGSTPRHARRRPLGPTVVAMLALAAVAAGCGGDDEATGTSAVAAAASEAATSAADAATGESATDEAATESGETTGGAGSVELKDGSTFTLAPRIKAKVDAGEPVNYVFSYQSSGIQGFSQQYKAGFEATQDEAKEILPGMTFKAIAPSNPQNDIPQQIAQIQALLNTEQIDCLGLEPATADAFTQITNEIMAKGIPVFTVGVTTNGNELTNFTQVPDKEGRQAAATVVEYMKANNLDFKTFAVSGGDPSQFWAQGRMKGFREGIMEAIPDATFVNTEQNALNVTYDPAKTLDAYKAFMSGAGKDVDVIQNVDIGAGFAGRVIQESGRKGKTFSVGWNVTPEQAEAIRNGTQIALFDQGWPEQAGFGALACATFLKTGEVLPNTQELTVVTAENLDETLAKQKEIIGG